MMDIISTSTISLIVATSSFLGSSYVTATSSRVSLASDLYSCRELLTKAQFSSYSDSDLFYRRFYSKVRMLLL